MNIGRKKPDLQVENYSLSPGKSKSKRGYFSGKGFVFGLYFPFCSILSEYSFIDKFIQVQVESVFLTCTQAYTFFA